MTALSLGRKYAPRASWSVSDRRQSATANVGPFHLRIFIGNRVNGGRWSVKILWYPAKPAVHVLWISASFSDTDHEGPEEALQAALGWLRAVRVGMEAVIR